jgi:hypothetical protein
VADRPQPLFADHAIGDVVWHRASGERGVVVGYVVALLVDWGNGDVRTSPPCVLSDVRVPPPDEAGEFEVGATVDEE